MLRWVPDYANRSSTNLVSSQKAIVTETGFAEISIRGYDWGGAIVHLYINGKEVWYYTNEGKASSGATSCYRGIFLPVSAGDVITLDKPDWLSSVNFIPGKWA